MFETLKRKAAIALTYANLPKQRAEKARRIVKSIHEDFDTASERAVQEARSIVDKSNRLNSHTELRDLSLLGFKNVKQVADWQKAEVDKARALETMRLVEKYSAENPNYKFITVEQVQAICEKYGLLCVPADRFKGGIPEKNMKEITEFYKTNPKVYYEKDRRTLSGHASFDFSNTNNFYDEQQVNEIRRSVDRDYSRYRNFYPFPTDLGYSFTKVPTFVCATAQDIIVQNNDKVHGKVFMTQFIEDPIVLHFVKEGFIIVSKWGPEGNDPSLINEKMN